jgi:Flp pilus assembly protein TadD
MEAMQRAAALFQAGRWDEAAALCDEIERLENGRHFYAWHLLSVIALHRGQHEAALELASRALELDPRHVDVLCNRGAALRNLGRYEEALADYDRAAAVNPMHAAAHNNRGVALAALNRYEEAEVAYERALAINPADDRARFNRGLSRLVRGDLARGLADFEARWTGSDTQAGPRAMAAPQWSGREPLEGRTILLHSEQGLGDSIQFARYVPLVAARGATVLIEAHGGLAPLLAQLPGAARVLERGATLPPHDFHCPLMSLAHAFGTTLESIPAKVPYLGAPAEHLERWRTRLGARSRPRVGLAWSGSTTLRNDRNRSIPLALLAPLQALPIDFFSLQKEVRDADAAALGSIATFGPELADFRDTAALVELMDLVVSVDTAAAHLAGAMAKPVWVLLPWSPDWRWLLERTDSPWYPTARLCRQERPGDWPGVIARLARELPAA